MTAPTEKHRETAEKVLDLALCPTAPGEDARAEGIKEIAQALTQSERDGFRDGMKRAAEIALKIGEAYGEDEAGWLECSETIERAIFSESGEPDQ